MFEYFRRRRWRRWRGLAFPEAWRDILHHNVAYYRNLPPARQQELREHALVLLHEKHWEGCGGLTLTDQIRVTIAGTAAILLLNRPMHYFRKLISILVYPEVYIAEVARPIGGGVVLESEEARAGESWQRGTVVLAWSQALGGAIHPHDGHNVILHEFAHQLDAENGIVDGAPLLRDRKSYADWARVMQHEYDRLLDDVRHRRPSVLNYYGATNPPEFFAVATETFFERARALRAQHPELYEQLRLLYCQDPATLTDAVGG